MYAVFEDDILRPNKDKFSFLKTNLKEQNEKYGLRFNCFYQDKETKYGWLYLITDEKKFFLTCLKNELTPRILKNVNPCFM